MIGGGGLENFGFAGCLCVCLSVIIGLSNTWRLWIMYWAVIGFVFGVCWDPNLSAEPQIKQTVRGLDCTISCMFLSVFVLLINDTFWGQVSFSVNNGYTHSLHSLAIFCHVSTIGALEHSNLWGKLGRFLFPSYYLIRWRINLPDHHYHMTYMWWGLMWLYQIVIVCVNTFRPTKKTVYRICIKIASLMRYKLTKGVLKWNNDISLT